MNPLNFSELHRIEHQTGIAVPGKPTAVSLVIDFVAKTNPIGLYKRMTATIQNRRHGSWTFLRQVQIRSDIKMGHGLEMQLFNGELRLIDYSRDGGLQIAPEGEGIEAEHFEQLLLELRLPLIPVLDRANIGEAFFRQCASFLPEIIREHAIPGGGIRGHPSVGIVK